MSAIALKRLHCIAEQLQSVILQQQFSRCAGLVLEQHVLYNQFHKEYLQLNKQVRTERELYERLGMRTGRRGQLQGPYGQGHV